MDFKKRPTVNGGNVEIVSEKNTNNGYCGLDGNARVAVARLASNTPGGLGLQVLADNQTFIHHTPTIRLIATTTNATSTVMTTDGTAASSTNQLVLPDDTTVTFRGLMVARNSASESAGFEFTGVATRGSGAVTTTIVGTPSKTRIVDEGNTWDFDIVGDEVNGGVQLSVTGEAGNNISWVCNITYVGVTY